MHLELQVRVDCFWQHALVMWVAVWTLARVAVWTLARAGASTFWPESFAEFFRFPRVVLHVCQRCSCRRPGLARRFRTAKTFFGSKDRPTTRCERGVLICASCDVFDATTTMTTTTTTTMTMTTTTNLCEACFRFRFPSRCAIFRQIQISNFHHRRKLIPRLWSGRPTPKSTLGQIETASCWNRDQSQSSLNLLFFVCISSSFLPLVSLLLFSKLGVSEKLRSSLDDFFSGVFFFL